MTKSVKKSLIFIFLTALLINLFLLTLSFSPVRANSYTGLTGSSGAVTEQVTLESFTLDDKAVIRVEKPSGLKFTASVSETDLNKLPNGARFGTVVLPKSMLGEGEVLTVDSASSKIAWANNYTFKDGVYSFTCVLVGKDSAGVLTDLTKQFYGMEFCARAFVTYTYAGQDGEKTDTVYTQTVSKFPREVANSTLINEDSALSVKEKETLKTFAEEKDKIGYFNEEFGAYQVTAYSTNSENLEISYSTEMKYGSEKGSLKIYNQSAIADKGRAFTLDNLIEEDLSGYGYVQFNIYATHDAKFYFYNLKNSVFDLTAGSWTEIRVGISEIASADTANGANDISGLTFCFDGALSGSTYYISAMCAKYEHKAVAFDDEYGLKQITEYTGGTIGRTLSYSTEMKYGDEAGALKVVRTGGNWGNGQTFILNQYTTIKDLFGYDYVELYVWTDTEGTGFKFYNVGHTTLSANKWTKVKVSITDLVDSARTITTDGSTVTDLSGLVCCFYDCPTDGSAATFYVSAIYIKAGV